MPTDTHKPGVGIVLTKTTVNIVLFPFYKEGGQVNAICLKGLGTDELELALKVSALITSAQCYSHPLNIPLINQFLPKSKENYPS